MVYIGFIQMLNKLKMCNKLVLCLTKQEKFFCLFTLIILFLLQTANAGWKLLNSPTTENLQSIFFTSPNTGFAVGENGMIIRTTDGGETWDKLYITGNDLYQVFFTDANHGWIGGFKIILATTDGGQNWTIQYSQGSGFPAYRVKSIYFLDNKNGFAGMQRMMEANSVDNRLSVMKTTDGGQTWNEIWSSNDHPQYLHKIAFRNSKEGWIAGAASILNDFLFLHTTDGGYTWEYVPNPYYTLKERYELFIYNNWVFSAGATLSGSYSSKIMRSSDGQNWKLYDVDGNVTIRALCFSSTNSGWAGASKGYLYHTTDFGVTWSKENSPTSENIEDIMFISDNTGWACGTNGLLMKYESSTDIKTNINTPQEYFLYQNFPNPFNQVTEIYYSIPITTQVKIIVYDIEGKEISILFNGQQKAGKHKVKWDATKVASGIYFYRMITNHFTATKKMIILE